MIIQGSNAPIRLTYETDMSSAADISAALFGSVQLGAPELMLKHWDKEEIQFDETGTEVILPLTEDDTMGFPSCVATLEFKYLSEDGEVIVDDLKRIRIEGRRDRTKLVSVADDNTSMTGG